MKNTLCLFLQYIKELSYLFKEFLFKERQSNFSVIPKVVLLAFANHGITEFSSINTLNGNDS